MGNYYAYLIDENGHIRNRIVIMCDDDEEAKRRAQRLAAGQAVELWQEARMIVAFEKK